jgi:hypothetical protein
LKPEATAKYAKYANQEKCLGIFFRVVCVFRGY